MIIFPSANALFSMAEVFLVVTAQTLKSKVKTGSHIIFASRMASIFTAQPTLLSSWNKSLPIASKDIV